MKLDKVSTYLDFAAFSAIISLPTVARADKERQVTNVEL